MEERLKAAIIPVLCAVLLLGCVLRFVGLTRGDFEDGEAFYHFHPDQATLVDAAQRLDSPIEPRNTGVPPFPSTAIKRRFTVTSACPWFVGLARFLSP